MTERRYSKAIFPAVLLGFVLPHLATFAFRRGIISIDSTSFSKLSPLIMWLLWHALASLNEDTWLSDRSSDPKIDVSIVMRSMKWLAAIPLLISVLLRFAGLVGLVADRGTQAVAVLDPVPIVGMAWILLLLWDLRSAGAIKFDNWGRTILRTTLTALVFILSPGAAIGLRWLSREWALIHGRHRGAVLVYDHEDFKRRCAEDKRDYLSERSGYDAGKADAAMQCLA